MFSVSNLRSHTLLPHGSAPLHTIFKCPCSFCLFVLMCIFVEVGLCTQRPEELESQGVVCHRMWVLGTELGFSERAAHALTLCIISPATLVFVFLNFLLSGSGFVTAFSDIRVIILYLHITAS